MSDSQSVALILRPEVVITVIEDGAVLLDLDTKYFYSVNHAGWAILQMFEVGATRQQVNAKCREWGATAADSDAIMKLIDVLLNDKLVVATDQRGTDVEIRPTGPWTAPSIEKAREPLQRIMKSPFDPTLPLAE